MLQDLRRELSEKGPFGLDMKGYEKWVKDGDTENQSVVDIHSDQMKCFLFECVIRPLDNALVIHLKHLPPALRNPKFFEYATSFIRDRIGKYESLDSSFIGELDSVNKLNSLDLIFTKYYPAMRGDMKFIKEKVSSICNLLDETLVRELGEYACKIGNKKR